jgi:LytS/YehU family sensor histidine kinase
LTEEDLLDKSFSFSKGVGVSNIRNRLSEIYGDKHSLEFLNAQPSGLTVKVTIPYDRE